MGFYLDYNASTPVDERVLETMIDVYRNHYGNADSRTHQFGSDAKNLVENARQSVADLLGVRREAVCFTSCSTESNNLAILGLEEYGRRSGRMHIITTAIEHKSVLEPLKILEQRGFRVDYVRPYEDGRIRADEVLGLLRSDTLLVSVMHVNNETGTIQPVQELGEALTKTGVYFHVDAAQSCGKLVEELQKLPYDLLSLSAHKMYGPQGIGALVINYKNGRRAEVRPIMYGGGQEKGMRPGTVPTALIAGMGTAADLILKEYRENGRKYAENKRLLLETMDRHGVQYRINGAPEYGIDNTVNLSFMNYDSEALMLSVRDILEISNGSACTSHSYAPSYVLEAMGLPRDRIREAVRISWGREPIDAEALDQMAEIIKRWQ